MSLFTALKPAEAVRALGIYYVVTGIWPIVHLGSFMALTGPKQDTWLVKTFGAMVTAIGFTLVTRPADRLAARLGAASSLALTGAEIWYVARRRISPIYLADALLESAFLVALFGRRSRAGEEGRTR